MIRQIFFETQHDTKSPTQHFKSIEQFVVERQSYQKNKLAGKRKICCIALAPDPPRHATMAARIMVMMVLSTVVIAHVQPATPANALASASHVLIKMA